MKFFVLMLTLALPSQLCVCSAADNGADLAVVANRSTALVAISFEDLRLMLLGEKLKWPDGRAVVAVQTPPESAEKALRLKIVDKMSEASLKRYLMLAVFNGKEIMLPREVVSSAALKKTVADTPGAIGCIFVRDVDTTIKILKVDDAAPGDANYKLR